MGDYYKTSATIQEPRYVAPAPGRKQTPTGARPSGPGGPQPFPTTTDDSPLYQAGPPEPATVQRQPRPRPAEPTSPTGGQLKPAPVNPTLRSRYQGCERIAKRLLPLILLFFYSLLGGMLFHYVERDYESVLLRQGAPGRVAIDDPYSVQLEKRFTEIVLDSNYTRDRRAYEVRQALIWYFNLLDDRWRAAYNVERSQWDFVSAVFYSVSVYTTIGE